MNELMQRLERDFTEQIAGTTSPAPLPEPKREPVPELPRMWPSHQGAEL